ncbi:MAG TPA: NYN domain-containing protein [Chthoniobacteraceae bacterium]|nr:NYN domain-containing protein [Chthoniobacteraceae bacterium]
MNSSATSPENIALLIDADNAPAAKIDFIIAELAKTGVVNIRRAYGNWDNDKLKRWAELLHEYAIQPVQQFDLVKGKNATDMAMVIEALDILYTKGATTFCLVSSDCDFTPLARRLREDGKRVIGFGGQKTPDSFVKSCSQFLYLDEDLKQKEERKRKADPKKLKMDTALINRLRAAVEARADDEGWATLSEIGQHLSNQGGAFGASNYGFEKLSDLIRAIDLFETRHEKNGTQTIFWVRDRKRVKALGANVRTPSPPLS